MYGFQYSTDSFGDVQIGSPTILLADIITLGPNDASDKKVYPNLKGFTLEHVRSFNFLGSSSPDDFLHLIETGLESDGSPYVEWTKRSSTSKASYIYVFASAEFSSLPNTNGLLVRNIQGDVIINEEVKNFAYYGEATLVGKDTDITAIDILWDDFRFAWQFRYEITGLSDKPPLCFIEPAGVPNEHFFLLATEYVGSGTWRFYIDHHNANASENNSGPEPRVFVFAEYSNFTKPLYGIEVFDENQETVFHTGDTIPLQIKAAESLLPPPDFNSSSSVSFPLISRPAYLFTGHTIKREAVGTREGGISYFTINYHFSSIRPYNGGAICRPINVIEDFRDDSPVRNRDITAVIAIDLDLYL